MTENMLESQDILNLGEQLIEARTRNGVSVIEMAEKLKLTTEQIQALESENYDKLGPITFVKGYIRVYCREFNLNESDIMPFFFYNEEENQGSMQSFSRRTEREAKDSRLMLFSYALVALLIGSSVFFFLQDLNKSPNISPLVTPVSDSIAQNTPLPEQTNTNGTAFIDPATSAKTDAKTDLIADTNNASYQALPAAPSQVKIESTTQQPNTVPKSQLVDVIVMTFRGDSWVEIFDAEGERVAFGVKKQGYVMTLEGDAPFNVVLGKHYNVDVVFNDKKVDISNFPKNRLAKFNLPLSE